MSSKARMFRIVCAAAAASLLAAGIFPAMATTTQFSPALFSGLHWRNIGPYQGGREVAVAGVPGQPNVFYFGAVDGGVWKTTNAGWTWNPIFDNEPIASIGAIAVAPSNPNIIYVGTGEADPRSQISYGDGMYKSTDAGKTWTHIGLDKSQHIGTIIVDPHNPNRLFVAVLGNIYAATPQRGIYRSLDGGKTWKKVLYKSEDIGGMDLAFDPDNPQIIYATLWATRRPPWSVYPPSTEPGSGIYKSTDGGNTWTHLTKGLPTQHLGKIGIAIAPTDPNRVYAIVDAKKGGLYRSDDAGATWKLMDGEARIWGRAWYFGRVTVDPKNENTLYVMNTSTYRSTDGGKTFVAWKGAPSGNDYHELWIDPDNPNRMALSSDMLGTVITVDGGSTWSTWNNQPTTQYYHVYADNQSPFWVGGAVQDTGGHSVASDVLRGRITYRFWKGTCTGGESNDVAADPLSVAELYGSGYGGPTRCNMLTGTSQSISPLIAYPGKHFRHDWTIPVAFSMADKHAFYYANQFLFQTTDGGRTWQKISPDLSRKHPGIPSNLDSTTAADTTYAQRAFGPRWGVIYTIAPSPLKANTIWVGTDDGLIWVTNNDGKHWTNVTPPTVTPWSKVIMVDASHFDANTAYAAVDRHRLNDYTPHVFRTRNDGKTWTEVDNGLPPNAYVQAIKQDPKRKGMLWAGTSIGVYVSFDSGNHWQSLRLNMPVVEIRDFAFKDNSVAIATFGRGLWVLDDLSPLREAHAGIAKSPAWLFKPEPATLQLGRGGFGGSSELNAIPDIDPIQIWSGEPRASGAFIDYYLAANANGPVTLEVLNAKGQVVRHYSSATPQRQVNAKRLPFPAAWVTPRPGLPATAGMHRFAWDLRAITPGKKSASGGMARFFGGSGHTALPGHYTVKLTVDGHSYSQPLTVKSPAAPMQPTRKVHYSTADKRARLRLAACIHSVQTRVSAAQHGARGLRKQLAALEKRTSGTLASSIQALDHDARNIEGYAAPAGPDTSGEGAATPAWNSLRGLGSILRRLESAASGGMGPPRQAAVTGFHKAQQTADTTLGKWKHLETQRVPTLNAQLRKAGLPIVKS